MRADWTPSGQGHRETHTAAKPDLVPDGGAATRVRARDQAGRRGLLPDERRGLRAALLRRPRRARVARHPPEGRQAGRGLLRGRELLAAAGELLPAGDRVHRRAAGRPSHGAAPARRRVRLRRAAAARAPAAHLGQAQSARGARGALGHSRGHPGRGRARGVAAPVEDRDRDLPAQDDRLRLLHDRPRLDRDAQGRPLPPALQGRAVLPDRPLPRAQRRARVPRLARPRQGRLLLQGRARLQPPRGLRPARVRDPHRLAARRAGRARAHLALGPHRLARPAPLRARGRGQRGRRRRDLRDRLRERAPDGVVGAGPRRARPHRGPAGARHGGACPARADHRLPHRSAGAGRACRARRRGGRGRRRPRGLADPPRALRPARDVGRHPHRRRPRGPQARARRALRAAAGIRAGAAPGHRRAERRELRRRLVRALRRGHRATRSRSTQSPTATTSPGRHGSSRSRPRRSWPPST